MRILLLIIGGLVALGILFNAIRRLRNAKSQSLRLDVQMQEGDDAQPAEARVEPRLGTAALDDTQKTRKAPGTGPSPAEKAPRTPVDLGQPVPVLMDVDSHAGEPTFDSAGDLVGTILSPPRVVPRKPMAPEAQGGEEAREVVIINVMSRQPEGFVGADLLEAVLASGLRYGSMNIFHHYAAATDETPLFSMANMVKPGTFDLDNMKSFQTPGVCFFMSLPLKDSKASSMEVFDKMLYVAKRVAQSLQGELRDERRSVMTGQTVEHCRQRISEFSRKKLSRSGKYVSEQ